MVVAWNEAETVWYLIYTGLVYQLPRPIADAIFKRHQTGNSQRELILAVAAIALKDHPDILGFLERAKVETNNIAQERNDIVHGDYHLEIEEPFSSPPDQFGIGMSPGGGKRKHTNLFAGKKLEYVLPPLIADIMKLTAQLDEVRHHLIWRFLPNKPEPLPESMPAALRETLLQSHPELAPPRRELKWNPIRPTAPRQS